MSDCPFTSPRAEGLTESLSSRGLLRRWQVIQRSPLLCKVGSWLLALPSGWPVLPAVPGEQQLRAGPMEPVLSPGLWPGLGVSAAEDGEGGKSPPSFQSVLGSCFQLQTLSVTSQRHTWSPVCPHSTACHQLVQLHITEAMDRHCSYKIKRKI